MLVWEGAIDRSPNSIAYASFFEHPDYGICIGISLSWGRDTSECWWTIGDRSLLNEEDMIDAGNDDWVLKGCFIPVARAWLAVEDFFANPMVPSPRIEWEYDSNLPEMLRP